MHLTLRSLPIRGVCAVHSSQRMMPMEYMSTFSVKGLLIRSSGACKGRSGLMSANFATNAGRSRGHACCIRCPCKGRAVGRSTTTPWCGSTLGLHRFDNMPHARLKPPRPQVGGGV